MEALTHTRMTASGKDNAEIRLRRWACIATQSKLRTAPTYWWNDKIADLLTSRLQENHGGETDMCGNLDSLVDYRFAEKNLKWQSTSVNYNHGRKPWLQGNSGTQREYALLGPLFCPVWSAQRVSCQHSRTVQQAANRLQNNKAPAFSRTVYTLKCWKGLKDPALV